MDKETLLNNILRDLGEVETMVKTFQGQPTIPSAFLNLTEDKLKQLVDDFKKLKELNGGHVSKPEPTLSQEEEKEEEMVQPKIQEPTPVLKEETTSAPVNEIIETSVVQEELTVEETISKEIVPEIKEEVAEPIVEEAIAPAIEEIVEEKTISTNTEKEDNSKTLGESLAAEKKSVNEIIATNQASDIKKVLKGKPVADLTKGLGINDRFMFQRELFEGKAEVMKQTLQQLNDMPDFTSAQAFLKSNFNWDDEQEVTQAFINYVERRF